MRSQESGGRGQGAGGASGSRFSRLTFHASRWTFDVSRLPFRDLLLVFASAGLAFALYLRTLAPGLLGGDSGEFQFAAWLGGFAHPTGYPLYLLGGWLWTHLLPLGDPAWRMNAFSAVWGALAVGLLYGLARQVVGIVACDHWPMLALRLPALIAAATFAVSPTFWSQAVVTEVYTLNAALVIALLLTLVRWVATGRNRWLNGAAFLFGLGLTHHRTTILWLPAIALFVWLTVRRRGGTHAARSTAQPPAAPLTRCVPSTRWRFALLAALVLLPLLLYAYIPLTAAGTPYLHVQVGPEQTLELYTPTISGFVNYVTGRAFESEFRQPAGALGRLLPGARFLIAELTWGGVALGLLGLAWLARRARPLLGLTGLGFLTLLAFNLFYGIGDIAAYYIPLFALWSFWIALGVTVLTVAITAAYESASTSRGLRNAELVRRLLNLAALPPCLLAFILPVHLALTHFASRDQSRNDQARAAWNAILSQEIPQGAILVTNDRDEMMPFWYIRYVEAARPDLTGLFPLIQPGPAWADVAGVTTEALRSGRPVFLIKPMPGLEIKHRLQPAGALVRVRGPAAERPPDRPAGAVFADAIRLTGYDVRPAALSPGGAISLTFYWQPARRLDADYTTFVQLLNADDAKIGQSDHRPGGVYYPTSLWKPGETLADTHTLILAADLGRPPYTLLVGLYTAETALRHLGSPQRIGEIGR